MLACKGDLSNQTTGSKGVEHYCCYKLSVLLFLLFLLLLLFLLQLSYCYLWSAWGVELR